MASILSNLIKNLTEGIHKIKSKHRYNYKKSETCKIKYQDCHYLLEYTNFKDDLIKYICLCCNKNYKKSWLKI